MLQPRILEHDFDESSMMHSGMPLILVLMMTFAQEHIFVHTVGCKCYCRRSQPWKGAFESIESGERASSPPNLPGNRRVSISRRPRYRKN